MANKKRSGKNKNKKTKKHAPPAPEPTIPDPKSPRPTVQDEGTAESDDLKPFPPERTSASASNKKELADLARERYGPDYDNILQNICDNYEPRVREVIYPTGMRGQILNDTPIIFCLEENLPPTALVQDTAFKISPMAGKGEGMLATRKIMHGDVIVVEYPIVSIPVMSFLPPDIREDMFRMLFDRVEEPERTELYNLSNCKPPEMCGREEGIARTNGVGIELHVPPGSPEANEMASGVFLKISKCNHSCSPNANYDWDLRTFTLSLYATRVINPGEEITISYIPSLTQCRADRRAELQKAYSFQCECPACDLPAPADVAASDRRRLLLDEWERRNPLAYFATAYRNLSRREDLIAEYKRAVEIHEKEGLEGHIHYVMVQEFIATLYARVADAKNFNWWMQRTVAHCFALHLKGKLVEALQALCDPHSLWYWGVDNVARGARR